MSAHVSAVSIEKLLDNLRGGEFLVPQFQRDFVWSVSDVEHLIWSIFEARPIGMVTMWEQADDSGLELAHISLPDTINGARTEAYFGSPDAIANRRFAILDGRQRCTAIAMAFGGLRPQHGNRRGAGAFFLNLAAEDAIDRVKFVRGGRISSRGLGSVAGTLAQGMVPLALQSGESLFEQWVGYTRKLTDPAIYVDGEMPDEDELRQRVAILSRAFKGLTQTELAVYTVPPTYELGDICEIFETLNTTGTMVSTVDLVHSWLYQETQAREPGPILLRDWLTELGETPGAIGWASAEDRPELTAQLVTACHVASEEKPDPRRYSGQVKPITSVKAADLLSTPTLHWEKAVENSDRFASWVRDFQQVVAGGLFPATACPYPASASVYVSLRWAKHFDPPSANPWTISRLDSIYRAFFWRNVLATRYDQGFLTQIGADIKGLKQLLVDGHQIESDGAWAAFADERLEKLLDKDLVSRPRLVDHAADGSTAGAMRSALRLPMLAGASRDLLDHSVSLEYPYAEPVELHHIFPRKWCQDNAVGDLGGLLAEKDESGRDWVNAASNLMPLSRKSNQLWRSQIPGKVLVDLGVDFDVRRSDFEKIHIGRDEFELLRGDHNVGDRSEVGEFWRRRAESISDDLLDRTKITLP